MSTNAEIIELAMSRLGQRKSTRVRADVISEINSSIVELERGSFHPWFLEETATLSIVADDVSKALPTDFLIEAEESRPYYVEDGTTYYLTKRFYSALLAEVPTTLKYYAIRGETLHFRMVADKAYTIYVDYYAKTSDPIADNSNAATNPWLINAKDWVIYEALTTVATLHLQNQKLGATMSVLAGKAKGDLYTHHEARINENQDFEVGEPPMGLETGTYISDLVTTNPASTDKRRQGDDHLRLIKSVLKNSFPNITGAVTVNVAELNRLAGVTGPIQSQLEAKLSATNADGAGLTESSGVLNIGAGAGIAVAADSVALSLSGLAAIEGNAISSTADGYIVDNAGTPKRMAHSSAGLPITTVAGSTKTLATADMNTYIEMNNAGASTVTLNTGVGKKGNVVLIEQTGAGQVTVAGTATIYNANGLKTNLRYSVIALVCKGSNVWTLYGDATP